MSVGLPCVQAGGIWRRHLHGSGTEAKHGWNCPRRVSGRKGKDKTLRSPNFHEAGIGWKFLGSCSRPGETWGGTVAWSRKWWGGSEVAELRQIRLDSTTVQTALTPIQRLGHLDQCSAEQRQGGWAAQGWRATGRGTRAKLQWRRQAWGWGRISGGVFCPHVPPRASGNWAQPRDSPWPLPFIPENFQGGFFHIRWCQCPLCADSQVHSLAWTPLSSRVTHLNAYWQEHVDTGRCLSKPTPWFSPQTRSSPVCMDAQSL